MPFRSGFLFSLLSAQLAITVLGPPAWAASGAEVLTLLNHDSDQTLELPEVLDAASKVFSQLNTDSDLTLERSEVAGRFTEQDWRNVNKDRDKTLEVDEWLAIARQRFNTADANKDGKLSVQELDNPAGQSLVKLIVK